VKRRAVVLAAILLAAAWAAAPPAGAQVGTPSWDGTTEEPLPAYGSTIYVEKLPEAVHRVEPTLPDLAREAGVTGTVVVWTLVGKDGRVKDARVVESIPLLDAAAVAAVRQWVFRPAQSNGLPVTLWVEVPVRFGPGSGTSGGVGPIEPRRAFVAEVMELQAGGPRVPSAANSAQRRRIVLDALALEPPPIVPETARAGLERGRHARERCGCRDSTLVAVDRFTAALHEAPWWGEAYQRLGEALLRLDRRDEALVCLDLCLLTGPEPRDRERIEKQIAGLRKRGAPKP
jgi:TonB family protein